ncbi:MAG TPA: hypothetical protein PL009_01445 [Flavipsychrobacter sp.]|nr:hypothetical protein [Flavipsychrobacter sp.]
MKHINLLTLLSATSFITALYFLLHPDDHGVAMALSMFLFFFVFIPTMLVYKLLKKMPISRSKNILLQLVVLSVHVVVGLCLCYK